jgi:hypothetical protein
MPTQPRINREIEVSLWDALDVDTWCPVAEMTVTKIEPREVHEFARRWHYTNSGGSTMWNYGIWDSATLAGVISFNTPTMETCESVFGADHWRWVTHMGRLICAETAPRNTESRLIGLSLKMLAKDRPDTRAVLTYAAHDVGHIGYVYQATNAIYTGQTKTRPYYIDQKGKRRGDFLHGKYVDETRAAALGWGPKQKGQPKNR